MGESGGSRKPLLVLINPASGTKVARKMFKTIVRPELNKRKLEYEVMETEYAGHAQEFVRTTQDLTQRYSGLVTISGDGLIHEVYNGLAQRSDWETVSKFPLGIVPGGSGNALNCSLLRQLNQPLDGLNGLGAKWSGLNVATGADTGKTVPLDLLEVETANGQKVISFLGATIGLIADVDIGSEILRCVGYMRAYIWVVMRLIMPKSYLAKVSYLPLPQNEVTGRPIPVSPKAPKLQLPPFNEPVPSDWKSEEGRYYLVYAINLSLLDPVTLLAPDSDVDDGIMYLVLVRDSLPRREMIQWFLRTREGGHVGKTGVEIVPVRAFRIEPIRPSGYMSIDAESVEFGPSQGQILPAKGRLMVSK